MARHFLLLAFVGTEFLKNSLKDGKSNTRFLETLVLHKGP